MRYKKPQFSENIKEHLHSLQQSISNFADDYLEAGQRHSRKKSDLYKIIKFESEKALLEKVLKIVEGNESKASELLGISRGTLRQRRQLFGHYHYEDHMV